MMDTSDDMIFLGEISEQELEFRRKRRSFCRRRTEKYLDGNTCPVDYGDSTEVGSFKDTLDSEPSSRNYSPGTSVSSVFEDNSCFVDTQDVEEKGLYQFPETESSHVKKNTSFSMYQLVSPSKSQLEPNASLPQIVPQNECLLFPDELDLHSTKLSLQNEAQVNQSLFNLHEEEKCKPSLAAYSSGSGNTNLPNTEKSAAEHEVDLDLTLPMDGNISGRGYVPETPYNSALESKDEITEAHNSDCRKTALPSRTSNISSICHKEHYENDIRNSSVHKNTEASYNDCNDHVVLENSVHGFLRERRDNGLDMHTPYNSAVKYECSNIETSDLNPMRSLEDELEIVTIHSADLTKYEECSNIDTSDLNPMRSMEEEELEIVTIHSADVTNFDTQFCDKELDEKENILADFGDDTLPLIHKEQYHVPEMTEEQQNMLRKLWLSPQSESSESSCESPLMNALDLSTTKDAALISGTNSRGSLATLDLSVDDRIPLMSYMNRLKKPTAHAIAEEPDAVSNENRNRGSPFKPRKTPMKVISHKLGVLNIASGGSRAAEEIKCPTSAKKELRTPKFSNIPVPQTTNARPTAHDFKKPLLLHGIGTYKSKVSVPSKQRFFSSPCVTKKWNVASPVSQYINEDPVQPFVKIVRPKDQKMSKKVHKTEVSSPAAAAATPSSHEKVVVAHYKLKQSKMPTSEDKGTAGTQQTRIRLFPSPFTPTPRVMKHEGKGKGIPGATSLKFKPLRRNDSDSSDQSMNKSVVRTVVSQRSQTIFKQFK